MKSGDRSRRVWDGNVIYESLAAHSAAVVMPSELDNSPQRSSLQVAPLSLSKIRHAAGGNGVSAAAFRTTDKASSHTQMTPPTTPDGSKEELNMAQTTTPVFNNFLRAFCSFNPTYALSDSTVTLPLSEGDVVLVHSIHTNGWADGTLLVSGARGWLPTNYCEAYDPVEMRNLLKALLNFWDLLRSTAVNDHEFFCNQEITKGIIAGVRILLVRTHCLTRESALIQRHEGLRRARKSLMSELSSLVKSAKQSQEVQSNPTRGQTKVKVIIEELILKAFKIVNKAVRFLDVLEDERRLRAPMNVSVMATVLEESYPPPTPPAEAAEFSWVGARHILTRPAHDVANLGGATLTAVPANRGLSRVSRSGTQGRQLSQMSQTNQNAVQFNQPSSTIAHRVSLAGPSPLSQPQNFVSERLNSCHDTFLSHFGAFIGRLQLQLQSRPHLAVAVRQSAKSGDELLFVVDVVTAHNAVNVEMLDQSRTAMFECIRHLVHVARDVLMNGLEMEDVITPQNNRRLLGAATGCVKATGECVAKTKWVIERIGDFEYEFEPGQVDIGSDLSAFGPLSVDGRANPTAVNLANVTDSRASDVATASAAAAHSTASSAHNAPRTGVPIDKPLPQVPSVSSLAAHTPAQLDGPSSPPSLAALRPELPPLPRIFTTLSLQNDEFSPLEHSASRDSEIPSLRSASITASSAGSASTHMSRDSETSMLSQTSTRATTPDVNQLPRMQPSLSDSSTTDSASLNDDENDVESKLLTRTHAHELLFNKEGQVTGGSLAALVECLTTHEATPDAMFVSTFYLTFRLFCTPRQLAEALIDRFDYVGEAPQIASPVRLRTYNVFKGWLESHWQEETDGEALSLIQPFAEFKLGAVLPSAGKRLLDLSAKLSSGSGPLVPRLVSSMGKTNTSISQYIPADTPLPASLMTRSQTNFLAGWKAGGTSPSIQDFDPLEVARQLTIKQMSYYCAIMPEELLGSRWTKRNGSGAPNVKAMVSLTTGLTNFVAETILHYEEAKKRAVMIKQWIKIANQCLALHNYDALMAITCALTETSIRRLRHTWDNVSVKRKEILKSLTAIVDLNQNYKVLRARLHDHVPPCLPFLGMFLTDLTFVDVGNPAFKTLDTGLTVINFDKHSRTAKSIGELQRFQIAYRFHDVPDLQDWLQAQFDRVQDKDKPGQNMQAWQYRKSLALEPREGQPLRGTVDGHQHSTAPSNGRFLWMRSNPVTTV